MATAKVTVNGNTILDLTDATATADKILAPYTAYGADGSKLTGTARSASGVKYIYTDIDGDGAWDVSGYQYCSVDYAPVADNQIRLWVRLNDANDLTVQLYFYYSSATTEVIDWGDGTLDTTSRARGSAKPSHTYIEPGRYVITVSNGGTISNYFMTGGSTGTDEKLYAVEIPTYANNKNALFSGCTALRYVTILDGVETFGLNWFANCTSLVRCVIPESATMLGSNMFNKCTSLEELVIPNGVTSIGSNCFEGCSNLKQLIVPSNVTAISTNAFYTSAGTEFHFLPTTPPTLTNDVFGANASISNIYVPSASLSAYQTAQYWSRYANLMVGE